MKGKHHMPEEIIGLLKQAEEDIAGGVTVGEVCRRLQVNQGTLWRWRNSCGGMKGQNAEQLQELESENRRDSKIVSHLELDKAILKEAIEGEH